MDRPGLDVAPTGHSYVRGTYPRGPDADQASGGLMICAGRTPLTAYGRRSREPLGHERARCRDFNGHPRSTMDRQTTLPTHMYDGQR
jgi:hypothetical protein